MHAAQTDVNCDKLTGVCPMHLHAVKGRHVDDLVEALKDEGKLAPRTIPQVSSLLHTTPSGSIDT